MAGLPNGWEALPADLKAIIMLESFIPDYDGTDLRDLTPADPRPDLSLMDRGQELEDHFNQVIIPDTVLVTVDRQICRMCDNGRAHLLTTASDIWEATSVHGWELLSRRASNVNIIIRCRGLMISRHVVKTVFVPRNRLNILKLSQMFLATTRCWQPQHANQTISISCLPRSPLGARHSAQLVDLLAGLLHGLHNGPKTIKMQVPPGIRPASLRAALRRTYPDPPGWEQADIVHRNLFRECQQLLDMGTFIPHRLTELAALAFETFQKPSDPLPTHTVRRLPQRQMEEFTHFEVNGDCMLFLVFHGLSDFAVRQFTHPSNVHTDPTGGTRTPWRSIWHGRQPFDHLRDVVWEEKWDVWSNIFFQHENTGRFRDWDVRDLPFLVHHIAMTQAYLRYKIICFTQDWFAGGQARAELQQKYGLDMKVPCRDLLELVGMLLDLDTYMTHFRGISTNPRLFAAYDMYQVPASVTGMVGILSELHSGRQGRTDDQWYAALDTTCFSLPRKLRIPIIDHADWASVRRTFDDVNAYRLWWADTQL